MRSKQELDQNLLSSSELIYRSNKQFLHRVLNPYSSGTFGINWSAKPSHPTSAPDLTQTEIQQDLAATLQRLVRSDPEPHRNFFFINPIYFQINVRQVRELVLLHLNRYAHFGNHAVKFQKALVYIIHQNEEKCDSGFGYSMVVCAGLFGLTILEILNSLSRELEAGQWMQSKVMGPTPGYICNPVP